MWRIPLMGKVPFRDFRRDRSLQSGDTKKVPYWRLIRSALLFCACVLRFWAHVENSFARVNFIGDVGKAEIGSSISQKTKRPISISENTIVVPVDDAAQNVKWFNTISDVFGVQFAPISKIQFLSNASLRRNWRKSSFYSLPVINLSSQWFFGDERPNISDFSNAFPVVGQRNIEDNWLRQFLGSQSDKFNTRWKNECAFTL